MANERLTAQDAKTTKPGDDAILYIVDPSSTEQDPSGDGFQIRIDDLLKGRVFQEILGCLVFKSGSSPSKTTIITGDIVVYMVDSDNGDRMVIGKAKASITSVPLHFDDKTKFDKFIDTQSLL